MSDFTVKIEYKNRDLETVIEKEYEFSQYTELLNLELMRIIAETEDAFYFLTGEKKENWDEETRSRFQHVRHKLLDQANAIKRLPQTLFYRGVSANSISFSKVIAADLNSGIIK
jgi:hypothetical protein